MAENEGLSPTAAPGATAPNAGDDVVILQTNQGRIVVKFFPDKAPNHVANYKKLVGEGFYDGIRFHRVIPGFMIQAGCPNSKTGDRGLMGTGGPGYTIDAEFNDVSHTPGILSMARTNMPNTAGSQFFIMAAHVRSLDNQYSVFGQVVEGMDVVEKIVKLPRDSRDNPHDDNPAIIESATLATWPL